VTEVVSCFTNSLARWLFFPKW